MLLLVPSRSLPYGPYALSSPAGQGLTHRHLAGPRPLLARVPGRTSRSHAFWRPSRPARLEACPCGWPLGPGGLPTGPDCPTGPGRAARKRQRGVRRRGAARGAAVSQTYSFAEALLDGARAFAFPGAALPTWTWTRASSPAKEHTGHVALPRGGGRVTHTARAGNGGGAGARLQCATPLPRNGVPRILHSCIMHAVYVHQFRACSVRRALAAGRDGRGARAARASLPGQSGALMSHLSPHSYRIVSVTSPSDRRGEFVTEARRTSASCATTRTPSCGAPPSLDKKRRRRRPLTFALSPRRAPARSGQGDPS